MPMPDEGGDHVSEEGLTMVRSTAQSSVVLSVMHDGSREGKGPMDKV